MVFNFCILASLLCVGISAFPDAPTNSYGAPIEFFENSYGEGAAGHVGLGLSLSDSYSFPIEDSYVDQINQDGSRGGYFGGDSLSHYQAGHYN